MDRRDFFRLGLASLTGLAAGCNGSSSGSFASPLNIGQILAGISPTQPQPSNPNAPAVNTGTANGASLSNQLPASLVKGAQQELDLDLRVLTGQLPSDIQGHYFMVCARPYNDGTFIFNGDGMLHRLDLENAQSKLKSRLLKTPCYYADEATLNSNEAFNNPNKGPIRMSRALGVRNQANTALMPMGPDRLLACYDGGRPFEVDPVSLDVKTPVGAQSEWTTALDFPSFLSGMVLGEVFPVVLSTAHPSYDHRTGELFLCNYSNQSVGVFGINLISKTFTDIMRWDGQGQLEKWTLVDNSGKKIKLDMSAHQMQVTEQFIIIMDSAFLLETNKLFNVNAFQAQKPNTVLYIIPRQQLQSSNSGGNVTAKKVIIPREAVHFVASYENPNGRISILLQHNESSDGSEWLLANDKQYNNKAPVRQDLVGMFNGSLDISSLGYHQIDGLSGQVIPGQSFVLQHNDYTWTSGFSTFKGSWAPDRLENLYFNSLGFSADNLVDRVGKNYENYPNRSIPLGQLPFQTGKPGSIYRLDLSSGQFADGYILPAGRIPSSPQFMPRQGSSSSTDGYIVCSVISDDKSWADSSGDEFWIFDAQNLAQGPICRLGHPQLEMPFTLHCAWLPSIQSRNHSYKVDVEQDHKAAVDKLDTRLQDIFKNQVYPHFI